MPTIYPILLCGGSGRRLWPISRQSYPKQFSRIIGNNSLLQQSALRFKSSKIIQFEPHLILTNLDFRFIVQEQLNDVGINPGSILVEPEFKNTAPAILAACLYLNNKNPDSILLVAPSDHLIPNLSSFYSLIKLGLNSVSDGKIVTFGISPTYPETGYGYLELTKGNNYNSEVSKVVSFIEKPNLEDASKMIEEGNYGID